LFRKGNHGKNRGVLGYQEGKGGSEIFLFPKMGGRSPAGAEGAVGTMLGRITQAGRLGAGEVGIWPGEQGESKRGQLTRKKEKPSRSVDGTKKKGEKKNPQKRNRERGTMDTDGIAVLASLLVRG